MKILVIAALALVVTTSTATQNAPSLPSSDEVTALRQKLTKALDTYEPLVSRQPYVDSQDENKQVKEVGELRSYLQELQEQPDKFNGILGFVLLETLHNVEDFAAACSHVAIAGKDEQLDRACLDAALLLADAVNSTQDLYAKYIAVVSERNCTPSSAATPHQPQSPRH